MSQNLELEGKETIPADFESHFRQSPLTDPWEPLYSRRDEKGVTIGLRIAGAHSNSRGFAHGGLISSLADNAMGLTCMQHHTSAKSMVTVNLSVDFLGIARTGQWLEFRTDIVKTGKSLCFAECVVVADDLPCARATSTFKAVY